MNISNIKKITFIGLLTALFYIFSIFLTINPVGNIKFTLQSMPLFIGAAIFGPIAGALIGGVGMLLNQMLSSYGLTPTTILWILPYVVSGFFAGIIFEKYNIVRNKIYINLLIFIILNIIITFLNTIAFYIDFKMLGYYNYALVFGNLIYKIISGIILAIIYANIIPFLVKMIKKQI